MGLIEELNGIGDAIREKKGTTEKIPLKQMKTEILSISGGLDDDVITFEQTNDQVKAYLADADSKYTDSNYTTVSVVDSYADASKNYDDPKGYALSISATGTIYFVDENDNGQSWSDDVSAGTYTVYNLIPNHVYRWYAIADGKTGQNGKIKATGKVRQIYSPNVDNCRDFGGWACDGGTTKYGLIFRGVEPSGDAKLKKTLVDVCKVHQEIDLQEENAGNKDLHFSKSGIGGDVTYLRFPFSAYYKDLINLSGTSYPLLRDCLSEMMTSAARGVPQYFHCSIGSDRTGTVTYMLQALLGVSAADCDKNYELTALAGSIWGSSVVNRKRTIHPKDMRTYLASLMPNGSFRDCALYWCYKAGIDIDIINAYRHTMIDGTPEEVSYAAFITAYKFTFALTNADCSNKPAEVNDGDSFTATVTKAASNYNFDTVKVTMGGTDITASVWNATTSTISIAKVTGDVVITIKAVEPEKTYNVTNILASATTSTGAAFGGTGYAENKYIGTAERDADASGWFATGYLASKFGKTGAHKSLYVRGANLSTTDGKMRCYFYDASHGAHSPYIQVGTSDSFAKWFTIEALDAAAGYYKVTPKDAAQGGGNWYGNAGQMPLFRMSLPHTGGKVWMTWDEPIE